MRVGVGSIYLKAMGHSLGSLELQGVVGRDALSPPVIRIGIDTDEGRAQSSVSIGERELSDRRLHLLSLERARKRERRDVGVTARRRRIGGFEAVAINLPVDWVRRRRDPRLVKGNRDRLVYAVISDIGQR